MTKVSLNEYYGRFLLEVEGHAGSAPAGEPDLVCAAVSILCYTLLQCLEDAKEAGELKSLSTTCEEGNVTADVEAHDHGEEHLAAVLSTVMTGFRLLEDTYPGHVRVQDCGYLG